MNRRPYTKVVSVPLDDILTTDEDIIKVKIKGKPYSLRRDLVDFSPGHVIMPAWLYNRMFKERPQNAHSHQ